MNSGAVQHSQILIIDDDEKFCRLLRDYLRPFGFDLTEAYTGIAGINQLSEGVFDAVVLDLMLPGMNGFDVLKRLGISRRFPVLMLTARGEEAERVTGLELGADHYLCKTASPREILAHLRAMTRRPHIKEAAESQKIVVGELRVDEASRIALLRGTQLSLTSFEFDLLFSLARAAGRIRTRDELLQETASRPQSDFDRSIDVHISSLRRKLGDSARDPKFIVTIRNTGYMIRRPE
jgi:two-component system response regulator CpxR